MNDSNPHYHLNPESNPRNFPDSPWDNEPDTVATPEGDNEAPPDQPLGPAPAGLQHMRHKH